MSEVTSNSSPVWHENGKVAEELLPLVYEELRRLARHKMAHQPPEQTLQATALVHEAYLRLMGDQPVSGIAEVISSRRRPKRCGGFSAKGRAGNPHANIEISDHRMEV